MANQNNNNKIAFSRTMSFQASIVWPFKQWIWGVASPNLFWLSGQKVNKKSDAAESANLQLSRGKTASNLKETFMSTSREYVIGEARVARATPIYQVLFHKTSRPQALKPTSPQTLKTTSPQTLKPQALKPLSPQVSPQTMKSSNPQALKPSSPQTLKHSSPQTVKPSNS